MGLFAARPAEDATPDLSPADIATARAALREAEHPAGRTDAITATIQKILSFGLDGKGPYHGAAAAARKALERSGGDPDAAISRLIRGGVGTAAAGGFVTSLGGFVTMPVAIPANLLEFYITATRTAGAIATVRGYDVNDPAVRTAILLTLVGSRSTDVLNRVGAVTGSNAVGSLAARGLPPAARMIVNKAIGFQLLKGIGERTLANFGRAVPFLGGLVGGVFDAAMAAKIADQTKNDFPPLNTWAAPAMDWGVR